MRAEERSQRARKAVAACEAETINNQGPSQGYGDERDQLIVEAYEAGEWGRYIDLHDRPDRLCAFIYFFMYLSDQEYGAILRDLWLDTEFPGRNRSAWLMLFQRAEPLYLMTDAERSVLAALPDTVTIYRGSGLAWARGLSWTTDRERAIWFARRFEQEQGRVFTTKIRKEKVLAFFSGRDESEIVIDPRRIKYTVLESD